MGVGTKHFVSVPKICENVQFFLLLKTKKEILCVANKDLFLTDDSKKFRNEYRLLQQMGMGIKYQEKCQNGLL